MEAWWCLLDWNRIRLNMRLHIYMSCWECFGSVTQNESMNVDANRTSKWWKHENVRVFTFIFPVENGLGVCTNTCLYTWQCVQIHVCIHVYLSGSCRWWQHDDKCRYVVDDKCRYLVDDKCRYAHDDKCRYVVDVDRDFTNVCVSTFTYTEENGRLHIHMTKLYKHLSVEAW